jgi:hypothetical protein
MNPSCMKPSNLCNISESLSSRCFANRIDRSRVISCHSRDIGIDCLLLCNHYKHHGRGYVQYHDMEWYPVVTLRYLALSHPRFLYEVVCKMW